MAVISSKGPRLYEDRPERDATEPLSGSHPKLRATRGRSNMAPQPVPAAAALIAESFSLPRLHQTQGVGSRSISLQSRSSLPPLAFVREEEARLERGARARAAEVHYRPPSLAVAHQLRKAARAFISDFARSCQRAQRLTGSASRLRPGAHLHAEFCPARRDPTQRTTCECLCLCVCLCV